MDAVGVAVRFALYLDLAALFGLAAFGLYGLRGEERRSGATIAFVPLLAATALLGLLLSALGLATLAAGMAGVPLASVDLATIGIVVTETSIGTAWVVRMVSLLVALAAALAPARPGARLTGVTMAGAVALASLAWTGHGAMHEGAIGWVHLTADIAHLWAAGVWVGALLALVLLVFRKSERIDREHLLLSHRALAGFSAVGTIAVAVIVVSGLVNGWLLVGPANIGRLPSSPYGQLLIAKLVLFGAMLALAAGNRFRLVPAFERSLASADHGAALRALRHSLASEAACAAGVLALVAWLGTLEPPPVGDVAAATIGRFGCLRTDAIPSTSCHIRRAYERS